MVLIFFYPDYVIRMMERYDFAKSALSIQSMTTWQMISSTEPSALLFNLIKRESLLVVICNECGLCAGDSPACAPIA